MTIFETLILIVNVCVLKLSIMDKYNDNDHETRKSLGSIIIGTNLAFSISALALIGVKIILGIVSSYKQLKQ